MNDGATEICAIDGAAYRNRGKGGCPVCEVRERLIAHEQRPQRFEVHQTFVGADPDRVAEQLQRDLSVFDVDRLTGAALDAKAGEFGLRREPQSGHDEEETDAELRARVIARIRETSTSAGSLAAIGHAIAAVLPRGWTHQFVEPLPATMSDPLVVHVHPPAMWSSLDACTIQDTVEDAIARARPIGLRAEVHVRFPGVGTGPYRNAPTPEPEDRGARARVLLRRRLQDLVLAVVDRYHDVEAMSDEDFAAVVEHAKRTSHAAVSLEGALALSRTAERNARNEMGALIANLDVMLAKLKEPRG